MSSNNEFQTKTNKKYFYQKVKSKNEVSNKIQSPNKYNNTISENSKNENKESNIYIGGIALYSNRESIVNNENNNEINYNKNKNGEKNIKKYEINDEFWYELRKYFIKVGIINFLNLIKNFQFYDRGNNIIEIKNFIKILNDLEINIDDELFDKIFYIFSKDNNLTINYIYFISQLIDKFINNEIIKLIENIYESIKIYCLNIKGKSFDFEFFKKIFMMKIIKIFLIFLNYFIIIFMKNINKIIII